MAKIVVGTSRKEKIGLKSWLALVARRKFDLKSWLAPGLNARPVHRWSTAGRRTLFSEVHSYDRGALYTYCEVHSYDRRALYTFCDLHSYDRGPLYRNSVYIDGTPQNVEHCSAKYIPMTAERCTGFSCTLMVHRRTQNTVLRCTFL